MLSTPKIRHMVCAMDLLIGTAAGVLGLDGTSPIEGTRINHLARHHNDWWAADGKGRIHRNGEVVTRLPHGVSPLCVQPTQHKVWIGATDARIFGLVGSTIGEDELFATAPGRDAWYTPWGAPADVRSMTVDADNTLYINVHVGGILRYHNAEVEPTLDIDADVHQVAAHPSQKGAIFAATAHGLAATQNGHDFEFRTEGLHASYCRAVAVLDNRVLVSASTGPSTSRGRLYRGDLWEGPLEPITAGLPEWFEGNLNTACLVVRGDSVFAGLGDTVWQSDDAGDSWTEIATDLPKITCLA